MTFEEEFRTVRSASWEFFSSEPSRWGRSIAAWEELALEVQEPTIFYRPGDLLSTQESAQLRR